MNATIAVPYEESLIFKHFGKAKMFKLYTIENDLVKADEICDTDGVGHEELALWLITHGVNAVVCDDIGPGAQGALRAAGIIALAGVSGSADVAIDKLLAGTLEAVESATCAHHAGGCGGHCSGHCGGCRG